MRLPSSLQKILQLCVEIVNDIHKSDDKLLFFLFADVVFARKSLKVLEQVVDS